MVISGLNGVSKAHSIREKLAQIDTSQVLKRTLTSEEEEYSEMFAEILPDTLAQLPSYINVTGLNVTNKEAIDLSDYDPNYVLPDIGEQISDLTAERTANFGTQEWEIIENRRKRSSDFDNYFGLMSNRLDSRREWCHSFFGVFYYAPNNDGGIMQHPDNPSL